MSLIVLVASRNPKKLLELAHILDAQQVEGVQLVSMAELPPYPETPETGATFAENALIKARDGAAASGHVTIADDSGIAVDALNGMPGVLSARWSGSHGKDAANNELLLGQLADVPAERRGAQFISSCALVIPESLPGLDGQHEFLVEGVWQGRILTEAVGTHGFGYDPVFSPDDVEGDTSSAELTPEDKDARSHRGKALTQLVPLLQALVEQMHAGS